MNEIKVITTEICEICKKEVRDLRPCRSQSSKVEFRFLFDEGGSENDALHTGQEVAENTSRGHPRANNYHENS